MQKKFWNSTTILAVFLALAVLAVMPASYANAQDNKEPAYKPYHDITDAALVKEIVNQKTPGILIDARPKIKKFDQGHIPGAINIPASRFDKMVGYLPADKNALIVYYCEGPKCALSHKSAYKAEALGYTNIKVYQNGYPEWKKIEAPGCGDPELTAKPGQLLLIQGDQEVAQVMDMIKKAGLKVGEAAGPDPVQTGKFKPGKEEGSIDYDEFKRLVRDASDTILLVDNRDPGEFKKGTIGSAQNIPTDTLEKELKTMKLDKPVVYFCGTGARSGEAYYMTKDLRPDVQDVYYLDAEVTFDDKGGFTLKAPK